MKNYEDGFDGFLREVCGDAAMEASEAVRSSVGGPRKAGDAEATATWIGKRSAWDVVVRVTVRRRWAMKSGESGR